MTPATQGSRLPLYVLTGFLGSGKTSLLRNCLESVEFSDTAVLVNEFGATGLDHDLLESSEEDIAVMSGGCLCCAVREDLAVAIDRMVNRRDGARSGSFSRLVIETSGLADPARVLDTVRTDPRINRTFHLRGTVVAVDALLSEGTLARHTESMVQIIYATRAIITKCDLVTGTTLRRLHAILRDLNPEIDILHSDIRGITPGAMFDGLRDDAALTTAQGRSKDDPAADRREVWQHAPGPVSRSRDGSAHSDRIKTFSWEFDDELDWTVFGTWLALLLHSHGQQILRVKGILNVAGSRERIAIHGVRHKVYPPRHMKRGRSAAALSRLVFITDGISCERIRVSFDTFRALGNRISRTNAVRPLANGSGRSVGGYPRRRARAPAWIKG